MSVSRVRFNGTFVYARNALRLHKSKPAAYEYRWDDDVDHLLPEHYKQRCEEFMRRDPIPVHYRMAKERFKINPKTNRWEVNQNEPVRVVYPEECNNGLWAGEGIVVGDYLAIWRLKRKMEVPRLWRPCLQRKCFYSEILDKWYHTIVTPRTCNLIDDAYGFDNYILQTHERDLNSRLGMKFKRAMLLALVKKDMYPDDPEKRERIYNKYKQYIIPEEEAEWIGLSIDEAVEKGRELEEALTQPIPLKYKLAKAMTYRLQDVSEENFQEVKEDDLTSKIKKLNPFGKSKEKNS